MHSKNVAILDVGSSKISVVIGERGINNTFCIRGNGEAEYAGFCDGEFLDEPELKYAMGLAISNAEANAGQAIESLYIGVPAEFCYCDCKVVQQNYPKRKKINDNDIYELFNKAVDSKITNTHTLLSCSPIYFVLDDNRKTTKAKGQKTSKLIAYTSCIYSDNSFIKIFNKCLEELEIKSVEYVSSTLAEAQYLLDEDVRDRLAILVDCGYITTSVALVQGNGLLLLNAFSLGGGHITADLCEVLEIGFADAETLKREIVLSINAKRTDSYEVNVKDKILPIPIHTANEIVASRIDMISSLINKCLLLYNRENPEFIPVHLTGGGLSYIKGAKDYLAKCIGRNVELAVPPLPQMNKPHLSSTLGLLDYALKKAEEHKGSLFERLLKKIVK